MKLETLYGHATVRPMQSARIMSAEGCGGFPMDRVEITVIAIIISILAAIVCVSYRESQRPTFSLKKDDWTCAASHKETVTTYVDMGGGKTIMLMPITTTTDVCDSWVRK